MTLYHRPASLFVAEFIGSPKMNLFPAKLVRAEATYAVVELAGQQVTAAVDARSLGAGANVQVGIRPNTSPSPTKAKVAHYRPRCCTWSGWAIHHCSM
jgi:ABC-type sugar transport system ATPase subunit